MELGYKLRNLRKQRDLTLDDISHKTGVGKATLSRLENNITKGTLNTHLKVCKALGIEIKQLYEDIETPEEIGVTDTKQKAKTVTYNNRKYNVLLAEEVRKKRILVIVCSPVKS